MYVNWIKSPVDMGCVCPIFQKDFTCSKTIISATLFITAQGLYEATLNEKRIGNYVLAPGWTVYKKRLQYQSYDFTTLLEEQNTLCVTVVKFWYRSRMY